MKEGLVFNYDGYYSSEVGGGLLNVSVSGGMFEEAFIASRKINEQQIRGRDKPYHLGVQREPLSFKLAFAFEYGYDEEKVREVARWLDQDYYKPFFTDDNPNRIIYCMPEGDLNLFHNGLKQGYLELNMRCDSSTSYSPISVSQVYDLSQNVADGTIIEFANIGDVDCKPDIWITKVGGGGDVSIVNTSVKSEEFKFTGLADNEEVFVDNELEQIQSSISNSYPHNLFNDNYLSLPWGLNELKVIGNCKIQFRYVFKTLQG